MLMSDKIVYKEVDGELVGEPSPSYEQELRKKQYDINLSRSGIPKKYWNVSLRQYSSYSPSMGKVLRYIQAAQRANYNFSNLYLYGKEKSSKTLIACLIGKEFIKYGHKVKFLLADDLTDLLLKNYGFDAPRKDEQNDLLKLDLLILDGAFEVEKSALWKSSSRNIINSSWYNILRKLSDKNIRIVITSSTLPNYIQNEYGSSLQNLLNEFLLLPFENEQDDGGKNV